MAKHVWSVLCKRAIIDKTLNTASLIDTIEEIEVQPSKPLIIEKWQPLPIEAVIVVLVVRSDDSTPERPHIRLDLIGPNGERFQESPETDVDLTTTTRARTMVNLATLPFRGSGKHRYVVNLEESPGKWREVADIPIDIKLTNPVPAETPIQTNALSATADDAQRRSEGAKKRRSKT